MPSDFNDRNRPDPSASGSRMGVGETSTGAFGEGSGTSRASAGRDPDEATARASLHDDRNRVGDALGREASDAKDAARSASESIRGGASNLAAAAKDRLGEGVESGMKQATSGLGDFAAAVRKASDELGERDQSMAAGLMREVASGIEQAANSIGGTNVQDLGRSVSDFARRQPTTFLLGAALAGIALGRFARASGEHARPGGGSPGTRYAGPDTGQASRYPSGPIGGASTSPTSTSPSTSPLSATPAGTSAHGGQSSEAAVAPAGQTPSNSRPYSDPSLPASPASSFGDRNVR